MNAITLAEYLDRHIHIAAMHDACANKLRRQHNELTLMHEAIFNLREALGNVMQFNNGNPEWVKALKVLNTTEDLK